MQTPRYQNQLFQQTCIYNYSYKVYNANFDNFIVVVDYAITSESLFTTVSGCSLLILSSFGLLNKKSADNLDLEIFDFLMYPSMSAPFSVFKLFENSISPLTVPELSYYYIVA